MKRNLVYLFASHLHIHNSLILERLKKIWKSPVYSFFYTDVKIEISEAGRVAHIFKCSAIHCQGKGKDARLVRHFTDKGDKNSTSNLKRHAEGCWGKAIVQEAIECGDISIARKALKKATLRDGRITAVFERTGKGKLTYSHRQHTQSETRFVAKV
jgi:hypothetical protein